MVKHWKTKEFDAEIQAAPRAVADFWADWCGPCRMLAPAIETLSEQYDGKAVFGKINVDEEPELAQRFGIMSIPTVIFFKNGQEIDRKIGVMPGEIFAEILDRNL